MPRTGERGGPQTRARIAEVAARLFLDRGFDAVTVAEVARVAGVSSVTVFNHFPRKEDLYLDRVEVLIELDETISAEDETCGSGACAEVRETLEGQDGIEQVTYRNRQQNYEHFVALFEDTDPALVANATPESLPAVLLVRLEDPTDVSPLARASDDAGARELREGERAWARTVEGYGELLSSL